MNNQVRTYLNSGPKVRADGSVLHAHQLRFFVCPHSRAPQGKVIPDSVSWGGQSNGVFSAMSVDFMKPVVANVDALLKVGAPSPPLTPASSLTLQQTFLSSCRMAVSMSLSPKASSTLSASLLERAPGWRT
jgi:hypothetical protein